MTSPLDERLERIWKLLMVLGEDAMARDVAEAKHALILKQQTIDRQNCQLRGEPQVFAVVADDGIQIKDQAG